MYWANGRGVLLSTAGGLRIHLDLGPSNRAVVVVVVVVESLFWDGDMLVQDWILVVVLHKIGIDAKNRKGRCYDHVMKNNTTRSVLKSYDCWRVF